MAARLAPVLRVRDAATAAAWYARLGFQIDWEHRFEPHLPAYVAIALDDARIHLSEHRGDAKRKAGLIYLHVPDLGAAAAALGVGPEQIEQAPWGRDFEVTDPDGNRVRIGEAAG